MRRVLLSALGVILLLVVGGVTWILHSAAPPLTSSEPNAPDNAAAGTSDTAPPATPQLYVTKQALHLTLPSPTGKGTVEESVQLAETGSARQVAIANRVLLTAKERGLIQFSAQAPVQVAKVWQDTLQLEVNPSLAAAHVRDLDAEQVILTSLVNSALDNSEEFSDVQLLVGGQRVPHLFGHLSTQNPLARQE